MNEIIEFMLLPEAWPFLVIFTVIPGAAILGHLYRVRMGKSVLNSGVEITATITRVSVDGGDCNVRYCFIDPVSGKEFARHGVIGFLVNNPPIVGDSVQVKYLPTNSKWSRLVGEIHLVSS
jgi:hypothetical protein